MQRLFEDAKFAYKQKTLEEEVDKLTRQRKKTHWNMKTRGRTNKTRERRKKIVFGLPKAKFVDMERNVDFCT